MTMAESEKKGITVKVDASLHAEVKRYLEENGITMSEFVSRAIDNELHPKINQTEVKIMENMRTMAFQVPESLFQRIKDYLRIHNMTQKDFVIGLIEDELDRDQTERQKAADNQTEDSEDDEESETEDIEEVHHQADGEDSATAEQDSPEESAENEE